MARNHVIWVPGEVFSKLKTFRKQTGFGTFGAAVNELLIRAENGGAVKGSVGLIAVPGDSRPFVITGPSWSGKTNLAKAVLAAWEGPALVFDVSNEYPDLDMIKDARDLKAGRFRILADPEAERSAVDGAYFFRDLARFRGTDTLKPWLVIVEEGHRFLDDKNLADLILEGRKTVGKLLICSSQIPKAWSDAVPVVRP